MEMWQERYDVLRTPRSLLEEEVATARERLEEFYERNEALDELTEELSWADMLLGLIRRNVTGLEKGMGDLVTSRFKANIELRLGSNRLLELSSYMSRMGFLARGACKGHDEVGTKLILLGKSNDDSLSYGDYKIASRRQPVLAAPRQPSADRHRVELRPDLEQIGG
ncbi:MAG: hypothetical protein Q9171_003741 [Xanthocarpia ochracea]